MSFSQIPWRTILASLAAAVAIASLPAAAQPSPRMFTVGLVWNSLPQADLDRNVTAHPGPRLLEAGLRDLGWIRGRNVELLSRSAESRYERFAPLIDAFVRMPVDVLVVFGPEAARTAQGRTGTIPIVFAGSYTPAAGGRAAGNLTGMTFPNPVGKRLELLKAMAPRTSRVGMLALVLPEQTPPVILSPLIEAARKIGLDLFAVYFRSPDQLGQAFADARRGNADAVYISVFPQLTWDDELQRRVHRLSAQHRLPAIYEVPGMAKSGGLIAFGTDDYDNYRRAAYFIDRILRGAKVADLPLEQPTRYYLNINRRTARELGLEIPASLLVQADHVFD